MKIIHTVLFIAIYTEKHNAHDKMFTIVIVSDYYNVHVLASLIIIVQAQPDPTICQQSEFSGGQTHNQEGVGLDRGHCTVGLRLQQGHT